MSIFTQARADTRHDGDVARAKALETISPTLAAAVEVVAETDSSDYEDKAAAAGPPVQPVENEITVQFREAYRARKNSTGELERRFFAFGNNPGPGRAPPHMRQMTAAFNELYIHHSTTNPSFITEDPVAAVIDGIRRPSSLVVVTECPATGTVVYVFFAQEAGRTYTWRAIFYRATVMQ